MRIPSDPTRRTALIEVFVLYLVTLLAISAIVALVRTTGLGGVALDLGVTSVPLSELALLAVPVLFMYAPVWSCQLRGADPWDYPMALPDWPWNDPVSWGYGLGWAVLFAAVVDAPFVAGYHLWQTTLVPLVQDVLNLRLYPSPPALQWTWPSNPLLLVGYHLFYVAIPEEMFYRGYLQSRLDEVFEPRWRVFGATVGPGLLLTCVLFAFGHSLVIYQWWHVFIIVPSLGFGWLRARTGGILAGAFFHAWCNVTVATLDTLYGIVPP